MKIMIIDSFCVCVCVCVCKNFKFLLILDTVLILNYIIRKFIILKVSTNFVIIIKSGIN